MRWSVVLVVLIVAGVAVFTLLSGGERADAGRGAEESAAESPSSDPRAGLVAPNAAESSLSEKEPSQARSELPDDAPRVRGVVRVDDGGELGEEVMLQVDAYASPVARPVSMDELVAADGSFAFLPPPGTSFVMLEVRAQSLYTPVEVRALSGVEVVLVAQRRINEADLAQDLVVSGMVLDEHGQPFAGAALHTGEPGSSSWSFSGKKSADDGRFELSGLARARLRIGVTSDEAVGRAHLDVDGTRGNVHGLVFTLERGGCIEGTVRWPDGTLVTEFELSAKSERMSKWSTCERGEFRMCGLSHEIEWKLEFTARSGTTTGRADVLGVRPSGPALDIVLAAKDTFAVEVIVHGPEDEAISGAEVWAVLPDGSRTEARCCGEFLLGGLTTGEWTVHARAEGYEDGKQKLALAPGSPPIEFRLERSGRVRGIVLDEAGNAVPGAEVSIRGAGRDWRTTDEQGRFELSGSSGVNVLCAKHAELGASDPLELALMNGRTTDDVVLRLLPAARLEGRVLDEHGDPLSGVWVHSRAFDHPEMTGEDGAFAFECLPAGTVEVMASAEGSHARALVTLNGGQTSTVELRMPTPDPVRVHGRATLAGKPYAGTCSFIGQNSTSYAECAVGGAFQVTLQSPGSYKVVRYEPESKESWALDLTIPDVVEHHLTLDLDTMRPFDANDEWPF